MDESTELLPPSWVRRRVWDLPVVDRYPVFLMVAPEPEAESTKVRCLGCESVDVSALADTFSTAAAVPRPPGECGPWIERGSMQPPVFTITNGIMRDEAGNPVEWDPGYLGYGAMLWRSGWPLAYSYRPLWLNLSLCVGWIVMALLLVVPALVTASVVRMALPTSQKHE